MVETGSPVLEYEYEGFSHMFASPSNGFVSRHLVKTGRFLQGNEAILDIVDDRDEVVQEKEITTYTRFENIKGDLLEVDSNIDMEERIKKLNNEVLEKIEDLQDMSNPALPGKDKIAEMDEQFVKLESKEYSKSKKSDSFDDEPLSLLRNAFTKNGKKSTDPYSIFVYILAALIFIFAGNEKEKDEAKSSK